MEIDSLLQLNLSLQALLLGWALGLVYDLLRALRLRCGKGFLSAALDVLYGLTVPGLLLFFALRSTGGELRVYQLLCALAGLALFFTLCSAPLRPLWDFWTNVLLRFWHLFLLPLQFLRQLMKNFLFYAKKLFLFQKKCYIISRHGRHKPGKRRNTHGKKK